jgi:transcriptional regulator with XRE-family HTH domain
LRHMMIPVKESFAAWRNDRQYEKVYNALEVELTVAAAVIAMRARAGLTQQQLPERMDTTQAILARLESGRVKPSTRTLARLAAATGLRLRISFEPMPGLRSSAYRKGCRLRRKCWRQEALPPAAES